METTHETDWRKELQEANAHLNNASNAIDGILRSMLPTPGTIAEYAQMQKVKQAVQSAVQAMNHIGVYLS